MGIPLLDLLGGGEEREPLLVLRPEAEELIRC